MTLHDGFAPPAPDPDLPCCMAAVHSDGENCTCWKPIYDLVAMPVTEGPNPVRDHRCHDCAYRAGSPEWVEHEGIPDYGPRQRFYCHDDMPAVIGWYHREAGQVLEAPQGAFDPTIIADRSFRADGRPATLCAGWARHNRLHPDQQKTAAE